MPYQSFGDLRIAFPGHTRYSDYYRELSLDSARAIVRYEVDGVQYQRETITLIYRSGSYGTTDRQPSGTNNLQRTAHLPSSGCNDSL